MLSFNHPNPHPDMNNAIPSASDSASTFLREKKLEFLHNAVRHPGFEDPGNGFFRDVAALVTSAADARTLCRNAFVADGKYRFVANAPCNVAEPFRSDRPLSEGLRDVWRSTESVSSLTFLRKALAWRVKDRLDDVRRSWPWWRDDPVFDLVCGTMARFGLSSVETNLLVFLYLFRSGRCDWFRDVPFLPTADAGVKAELRELFASVTGEDCASVRKALSDKGTLVRRGFVSRTDYSLARSVVRSLAAAESRCREAEIFRRPAVCA